MSERLIRTVRPFARGWARGAYRIEFEGLENVPESGPIILTPNHVSYLDPIWISIAIKRRIYYMAWDALFRVPVFSSILRAFGAFPVRIEGHDKSAHRDALEHLERGDALMIFPEGGRTTTARLMGFKPGAFRLALATGASIVPVTLNGAYEIWPPTQKFPRPRGHIEVIYHPPIAVERVTEACEGAEVKRRAVELAHQARSIVASRLDPALRPHPASAAS